MHKVKLSDVKTGDMLIPDNGFTCIEENTCKNVHEDKDGKLYIECDKGAHYLAGQLDQDGYLVGLTKLVSRFV